jgi:hypothetical protein
MQAQSAKVRPRPTSKIDNRSPGKKCFASQSDATSHNFCSARGMLERAAKSIAVILISCLILPGCAHFTKAGRQRLAYQRYVKKYSGRRIKQQAKFKKVKMPAWQTPSENRVSTQVGGSPESVTASEPPNSE